MTSKYPSHDSIMIHVTWNFRQLVDSLTHALPIILPDSLIFLFFPSMLFQRTIFSSISKYYPSSTVCCLLSFRLASHHSAQPQPPQKSCSVVIHQISSFMNLLVAAGKFTWSNPYSRNGCIQHRTGPREGIL
jgi:hypothetical protein